MIVCIVFWRPIRIKLNSLLCVCARASEWASERVCVRACSTSQCIRYVCVPKFKFPIYMNGNNDGNGIGIGIGNDEDYTTTSMWIRESFK